MICYPNTACLIPLSFTHQYNQSFVTGISTTINTAPTTGQLKTFSNTTISSFPSVLSHAFNTSATVVYTAPAVAFNGCSPCFSYTVHLNTTTGPGEQQQTQSVHILLNNAPTSQDSYATGNFFYRKKKFVLDHVT